MTDLPTPAEAAAAWNEQHSIGTPVTYWPGDRTGPGCTSVTRTPAWVVGDHSAVVSVEGYSGGIVLTHVHPINPVKAADEMRIAVTLLRSPYNCLPRKDLLADLLDTIAYFAEDYSVGEHVDGDPCDDHACRIVTAALAIARAQHRPKEITR